MHRSKPNLPKRFIFIPSTTKDMETISATLETTKYNDRVLNILVNYDDPNRLYNYIHAVLGHDKFCLIEAEGAVWCN